METKWRVGLIGVGARGMSHLSGILTERDDVTITCIADRIEERAENAAKLVQEKMGNTPWITTDGRRIAETADADCVVIASDWDNHVPATCACLRAGKKTACECGGAYTVDECWELVRAYEETGNHVMFLENCCYDRNELMVTRMVREGLFGEVVHCEGGYQQTTAVTASPAADSPNCQHRECTLHLNRWNISAGTVPIGMWKLSPKSMYPATPPILPPPIPNGSVTPCRTARFGKT